MVDATLLVIESLQREVEEWKGKYEMMREAHDAVLHILATREDSSPTVPPTRATVTTAPKAWSPIKLDGIGLNDEELESYRNGEGGAVGGEYLEHDDDIHFSESDYHPHDNDYDVDYGQDAGDVVYRSTNAVEEDADFPKSTEINEAYMRVPREDSRSVVAGLRAALDYMAQCQIKSTQKVQAVLSSLHMPSSATKTESALQSFKLEPALLKVSTY